MVKARVLAIFAVIVVVAVPMTVLDAAVAMDPPIRAVLTGYAAAPILIMLALFLAFKLVDWLRDSNWVTHGTALIVGVIAAMMQIGALGVALLTSAR